MTPTEADQFIRARGAMAVNRRELAFSGDREGIQATMGTILDSLAELAFEHRGKRAKIETLIARGDKPTSDE